jgi:hypothetical protein
MNDHGLEASLAGGFPMDQIYHSGFGSFSLTHSARHAIKVDIDAT